MSASEGLPNIWVNLNSTERKKAGILSKSAYRKVWGVWGPDVKDFATVFVTKANGDVRTADLGKVVGERRHKSGEVFPVAITRETQRENPKDEEICAECELPGRLVTDLEDGLRKHWRCCDIPPEGS